MQLAIETTGRGGSVAVFSREQLLQSFPLDSQRRSAATLAPAIANILDQLRTNGQTIEFVSVACGPGSFTGLRIGITTAKTLSFALGLPLVAVDSLAAIAASSFYCAENARSVVVAIDAYRGQVFRGHFDRSDLLPPIDDIPESWSPQPDLVSVQAALVFQNELAEQPESHRFAGDSKIFQTRPSQWIETGCDAIGVGLIGARAAKRGLFVDPLKLVPRYLKVSAAEENASRI